MTQITFILKVGREFGVSYGHFFRSLDIAKNDHFRNFKLMFITNNNKKIKNILKKNTIKNIKLNKFDQYSINKAVKKNKTDLIFVDLPDIYKSIYSKLKFKNQVLLSDNEIKRKNFDFLINYSILLKDKKNNREFLGPKFFFKNFNSKVVYQKKIKNIFISFGGSDFFNYGLQISKLIHKFKFNDLRFVINFGPGYKRKKYILIRKKYKKKNIKFLYNSINYNDYLKKSDLIISGGGITSYKVISSLKPLLIIPGSKFETKIGKKMHQIKNAFMLKTNRNKLNSNDFLKTIKKLSYEKKYLKKMLICQKKYFKPKKFNKAIKIIKNQSI